MIPRHGCEEHHDENWLFPAPRAREAVLPKRRRLNATPSSLALFNTRCLRTQLKITYLAMSVSGQVRRSAVPGDLLALLFHILAQASQLALCVHGR